MSNPPQLSATKCILTLVLLALPSILGCAQYRQMREEVLAPNSASDQLGVSPASRAIESSLGIE